KEYGVWNEISNSGPTFNPAESMNAVIKRWTQWKELSIDRFVTMSYPLMGYYVNEIRRGYCGRGSHDLRVAEYAAELYLQGWAPLLIFSGGTGVLTKDWQESEADRFAQIARDKGVPSSAILIENKSTNTGENILFTQELLIKYKLSPQTFIVVQKPYMERRSYATFKRHWPDRNIIVTSPKLSLEEYPCNEISMENMINFMVGDLQRIKIYPEKGFQIYQEIPVNVWNACKRLIELGFNKHLIVN
ncbi:unnamed protein product, partial [Didymodactylos carnosus]